MCLCQVLIQFLSLNFQVIQATLNLICNKSSFGWQGIAGTPWAFLLPMGLNWKKTHKLRRRNKCRNCFWVAERVVSILGVTQWEICLWDSGEEQKLCAVNQNRSFTLFLNTVYLKAALGWKYMQSLETNHRNESKKKNKESSAHPPLQQYPSLRYLSPQGNG